MPVAPTMTVIYGLDRNGGPGSPRFRSYRERVAVELGSPPTTRSQAGQALATVERLIQLDAEAVAARSAGDPEMAIVVASPGLWTDRIATEVETRTAPGPRAHADHFGAPHPGEDDLVPDAVELFGASKAQSERTAVLLDDPAARALRWQALGLPPGAGYRRATARTHAAV